jgi:hypothetical protein
MKKRVLNLVILAILPLIFWDAALSVVKIPWAIPAGKVDMVF